MFKTISYNSIIKKGGVPFPSSTAAAKELSKNLNHNLKFPSSKKCVLQNNFCSPHRSCLFLGMHVDPSELAAGDLFNSLWN